MPQDFNDIDFKFDPSAGGKSSAQPSAQPSQNPADVDFTYNPSGTKSSAPPSAPPSAPKTISEAEKPYENLIQKHMPTAKEQVQKEGATGAFEHGLLNVPFVTPAIQEGVRKYKAYKGEGEGASYDERLQDLRAKQEAYNRQVKEQHPYAELGGEVAQGVGLAFLPGVGWLPAAGRAAATTAAARTAIPGVKTVAPLAAELAGYGAEGAAFAGAQAAGEKQFGTQQPSEKPDVLESMESGAKFGAGLGAAGKAIGATFEKVAPEWVRGLPNKDKHQIENYFAKVAEDKRDGNLSHDFEDILRGRQEGLDLTLFDMRGPKSDAYLQEIFRNHPEAMYEFKNRMNERVFGSGERGLNFLRDVANVESFNPDEMRRNAQSLADKINEANFAKAYDRENGQGTWHDHWSDAFKDKDILAAAKKTNDDMARLYGSDFKSPLGRAGSIDIEAAKLSPEKVDALRSHGINTLDDINKLTPKDVQSMFGLNPKKATLADIDKPLDTSSIYKEIKDSIGGMDLDRITMIRPDQMNVEYLDRLQQQLRLTAKQLENGPRANLNQKFAQRLNNFREEIVNTMKDPASEFHNPEYAEAFKQRDVTHRNDDAFTSGMEFLKKLRDTEYVSKVANETAQMTPSEKEFFKQGLLAEMANQGITGGGPSRGAAQETSLNYKKIQNWLAKPDVERAMKSVLGKDDFARMEVYLRGEALMGNALQRAGNISERGNFFDYLMSHAKLPGVTGIFGLVHNSPIGLSGVVYRMADYYFGSRYAKSLADKMASSDPEKYKEAYDRIVSNPKLLDSVSRAMGLINYTLSTQVSGEKFNASRVGQMIDELPPEEKALVSDLVRSAHVAGQQIKQGEKPTFTAPVQRADGGRIAYGEGGKTPYNWRQHYVPKDDTVGPVAPARASGYYPEEWRKENRRIGFAARARAMRDRAAQEETPVDELMERPKRNTGGGLTQPVTPQSVTSEKTSLKQVPALFKSKIIEPELNHSNVDIGGGAYDLGTQYLANERGIESHVYDPFNRSKEHNAAVEKRFTEKPAHSATVANTLNVIPEREHRLGAIKRAYQWTRPEAKSYFSIHEGDKSGKGAVTPKGWQNNLRASHYVDEISEVFPHVVRKGKIIVGHKQHPDAAKGKIKRSTGGRIPEADKLFRDAKKYIDERTKGLLDQPDEKIVHALRIAKARNG